MKKFNYLIIILSIIFILGCNELERTYKSNGIQITMDPTFIKKSNSSATVYYESNYIIFSALEEKFYDLEEIDINQDSTILEYAEALTGNANIEFDLYQDDNLIFFSYESEVDNNTLYSFTSIQKGKNGFWTCTFTTLKENKDKYMERFINWSKSIKFY